MYYLTLPLRSECVKKALEKNPVPSFHSLLMKKIYVYDKLPMFFPMILCSSMFSGIKSANKDPTPSTVDSRLVPATDLPT